MRYTVGQRDEISRCGATDADASSDASKILDLWQHRTEFHHASLTENITAASPAATGFLQQLKGAGMAGQRGLTVVDQLISREAATLAVNDVFWLCSVIFILMIPLLWLAKPPFGSAGGPGGH